MSTATDPDLKTRRSLLSRLRDLDDRESWRTFFDLYWRMLYNVARRAGLSEADAQDVVQETVVAVARQMPEFHYDRAKGTFKHWLFRIVRRRVADHLRKVYRQPPKEELAFDPESEDDASAPASAIDTTGELGNAPMHLETVAKGDTVTVDSSDLSDWAYAYQGKTEGAFTDPAFRQALMHG